MLQLLCFCLHSKEHFQWRQGRINLQLEYQSDRVYSIRPFQFEFTKSMGRKVGYFSPWVDFAVSVDCIRNVVSSVDLNDLDVRCKFLSTKIIDAQDNESFMRAYQFFWRWCGRVILSKTELVQKWIHLWNLMISAATCPWSFFPHTNTTPL